MHTHIALVCLFLAASCGPADEQDRYQEPGNGNPGTGDQTGVTGDPCGQGYATVTGVIGNRDIGFRAMIGTANYEAPVDTKPGTLTLELSGNGKIWLQFMNVPTQGGVTAARGIVIRESADVAVGHCEDSVFSAQMALSKDEARKGSFYLTGLYGHDGATCDKQPIAGTLSGCFYY